MRYFFRRRVPALERVLVIESGSRHIIEAFLKRFLAWQTGVREIGVVTCYPGIPKGADAPGREPAVFRVTDYATSVARSRLVRELRDREYAAAVMLCSGEPIMTKWKWMLAARLPVKFLIVNENADFFWCDWSNWRTIRHFILFRAGLTGTGMVRAAAGVAIFPFTLAYLLAYAAWVHTGAAFRRPRL